MFLKYLKVSLTNNLDITNQDIKLLRMNIGIIIIFNELY